MSDEEYETVEEARVRAHVMSNAIVNGDANTVRFLLDSGTDPNIKDRFEETPLTNSSKEGLTEIIKILLEYGADPNIKNRFEWTPVMIASYNGLTEIVELLLDNGADPNIQNGGGLTALMHAINAAYQPSSIIGNEIVKLLLDNGADPNIKEYTDYIEPKSTAGETVIMMAAKRGDLERTKILLEYGADPNIRRDDGMTALDLAKLPNPRARRSTLRGKKEIVRLLEDIDPFDEVSDPDINLMKDEAARHIQTIMRARFEADKRRKLTKRRYGTWASPKTEVEKDRRYMDLIRQFDKEDPIRGYERYSIYPERLLPKKSSKKGGKRDRRKNKSKRERRKSKSKRKIMIEMNKI